MRNARTLPGVARGGSDDRRVLCKDRESQHARSDERLCFRSGIRHEEGWDLTAISVDVATRPCGPVVQDARETQGRSARCTRRGKLRPIVRTGHAPIPLSHLCISMGTGELVSALGATPFDSDILRTRCNKNCPIHVHPMALQLTLMVP